MAYQQPYNSEFHISHVAAIKIVDTADHGPVAGVGVQGGVGVYGSCSISTDICAESNSEDDHIHHPPRLPDLDLCRNSMITEILCNP